MKPSLLLLLIFLLARCSSTQHKLVQSGEAEFRITLNYGRVLSDAELDSIEKSKPFYSGTYTENKFYNLLERKGFVSDQWLDTTGLGFTLVTWEQPVAHFGELQLALDTTNEQDHIVVNINGDTLRASLGQRLLGDIFVCCIDIDDDGDSEILVMKKYYVIGGYNFNLKIFELT